MSKFLITGNSDVDNNSANRSKEPIDKKILGLSIGASAVIIILIALTVFLLINGDGILRGGSAFGEDENQEILRQKQELIDLYSHSDIILEDEDFNVYKDNDGNIVVEVSDTKRQELSVAKDNAINDIFNGRDRSTATTVITEDPDNPSNPDNPDNPGDPDNPEEKKIDEAAIIDAINTQNSNISRFFARSLDSSNEYYCDALAILLQSARTGSPSMSDNYDNHPACDNETAFSCLCSYVYTNCCELPDDNAIWTNSFLHSYNGDTLYNCIVNDVYEENVSNIDTIYKEKKSFYDCGTELTSSYVVYANGHYIYLTYELEVLDII